MATPMQIGLTVEHKDEKYKITLEQPDLLCIALALNIELLRINMCAVL
jgi:hypothetical protein